MTQPVNDPDPNLDKISELNKNHQGPEWQSIIREINLLLDESSWSVETDTNLSNGQKRQAQIYRKNLRDIMKNSYDPKNVVWPAKPLFITNRKTR